MKRYDAIKMIIDTHPDACIITSTGYISREAFHYKDRDKTFYMMGSMGCALAIGLGLAYSRPDLEVVVISGDGAVLMSAGTLWLANRLLLTNCHHYILNNGVYASTGGQPTCFGDAIARFWWNTEVYDVEQGNKKVGRVKLQPRTIRKRFQNAISLNSSLKKH